MANLKTVLIAARVSPNLKAAVEKAAEADRRTLSGLIEKVLYDYCKKEGFLK
jgi:hypothetical protein